MSDFTYTEMKQAWRKTLRAAFKAQNKSYREPKGQLACMKARALVRGSQEWQAVLNTPEGRKWDRFPKPEYGYKSTPARDRAQQKMIATKEYARYIFECTGELVPGVL